MPKSKNRLLRAIPTVVEPTPKTIQFSFKHLHIDSEKFSIDACTTPFWVALVRKLHEYSQWPTDEFSNPNNEDHRHIVDFTETSEQSGFSHLDMEQLGYVEMWQFQVGIQHWRVLGLLVDDIFYIVWLDPHHLLYAGYGGNKSN